MIQVRKLVAIEMVVLGTQVTVAAYAFGIVLPLLSGLFSLVLNFTGLHPADWQIAAGFWMVSVAANYVPLLGYALSIVKADSAKQEGRPELARVGRYTGQQAIVLVPFLVVFLSLVQELQHREAMP